MVVRCNELMRFRAVCGSPAAVSGCGHVVTFHSANGSNAGCFVSNVVCCNLVLPAFFARVQIGSHVTVLGLWLRTFAPQITHFRVIHHTKCLAHVRSRVVHFQIVIPNTVAVCHVVVYPSKLEHDARYIRQVFISPPSSQDPGTRQQTERTGLELPWACA